MENLTRCRQASYVYWKLWDWPTVLSIGSWQTRNVPLLYFIPFFVFFVTVGNFLVIYIFYYFIIISINLSLHSSLLPVQSLVALTQNYHQLHCVYTHFHSHLNDKDLCEGWNTSIKFPCALLFYFVSLIQRIHKQC